MDCPFTYANGRRCTGEVYRARAYGPHRGTPFVAVDDIRKIRLWCSAKDVHCGSVSDFEGKERMEFYPDELGRMGLLPEAIAKCDNVRSDDEVVEDDD
jgi:hypothetical protein